MGIGIGNCVAINHFLRFVEQALRELAKGVHDAQNLFIKDAFRPSFGIAERLESNTFRDASMIRDIADTSPVPMAARSACRFTPSNMANLRIAAMGSASVPASHR
ncbi:MAG: hypothetical protein U1D30_19590 [Planctomycetota bacterium]